MNAKKNVSRRSFLNMAGLGILSGTTISACGDESLKAQDRPAGPNSEYDGPSSEDVPFEMVRLFDPSLGLVAGLPNQRVPFAIVENTSESEIEDRDILPVNLKKSGKLVQSLTVKAHVVEHAHTADDDKEHSHSNLFRYFPLRVTFDEPGIYNLEVELRIGKNSLPIQVLERADTDLVMPGDNFPRVATPTVTNSSGVDVLCSRSQPCGLHASSVDELISQSKAFALLVATPAFCATSYCGPVLENILAVERDYPNLTFVHGEVYANALAVGGNYADSEIRFAEYTKTLGLQFEPCLFLVDSAGKLVDRLDNIYDKDELVSVLDSFSV